MKTLISFFVLSLFLQSKMAFAATATTPPSVPTSVTPAASSSSALPSEPVPPSSPKPSLIGNDQSFLEKYPQLKQNLFTEPSSHLFLGFSVGLLGILKDRLLFSANFFQVHYMTSFVDYEVVSISYGSTTSNPSYVQSNHFIFRTVPKYRVSHMISVGPLLGYEFVSFPKVTDVLYDGIYQTKTEPFSSSGFIFGVGVSQNIESEKAYSIRVNELIYQETYSTQDAGHGWSYLYDSATLRADAGPIKAGLVMLVEVGILF